VQPTVFITAPEKRALRRGFPGLLPGGSEQKQVAPAEVRVFAVGGERRPPVCVSSPGGRVEPGCGEFSTGAAGNGIYNSNFFNYIS
jgi:hypothetical protein